MEYIKVIIKEQVLYPLKYELTYNFTLRQGYIKLILQMPTRQKDNIESLFDTNEQLGKYYDTSLPIKDKRCRMSLLVGECTVFEDYIFQLEYIKSEESENDIFYEYIIGGHIHRKGNTWVS